MQLRGQYTLVIGGLVCASLLVLGAALLVEQKRYAHEVGAMAADNLSDTLERQLEKHGVALATSLAERVVDSLYHSDFREVAHEAAELKGYPDIVSATVVGPDGTPVRGDSALDGASTGRIELPWVHEALTTGHPASQVEGKLLRVAAPVKAGGHVLGAAVLDIALEGIRGDIRFEQGRLDRLIRSQSTAFSLTGIAVGIVLVTLAVLSAVGVAGGLSRPVVAFAARARRLGRGEAVHPERTRRRDEIGDLSRAFDEMAVALRETTVSKDWFDNVLRSMADMLLVTDLDGRVVTANPSCLAELGCDEEQLRGLRVPDLLPGLDAGQLPGPATELSHSFVLKGPGGGEVPVRVSVAPLRDIGGAPSGQVFVMQNVARRLAAEQQIERSLAEKEILLREIHHRVKNNLQIISSMLSLQASRSDDHETREVFHESEARIRAMALVHEQLYRSGDLAHVDLAGYLDTLAQQVVRQFGRPDCRAAVSVDEGLREVGVDQAIPVGLIVNELVANSVKHGFERRPGGLVTVRLARTAGGATLTVADDGVGFPPGLDLEETDSLGLRLVQALAEQLGGSLRATSEDGARCVVEMPAFGAGARRGDEGRGTAPIAGKGGMAAA